MPNQPPSPHMKDFEEIYHLIQASRQDSLYRVNQILIRLYWQVGQYVSNKIDALDWGNGVVDNLSAYLMAQSPDIKGFSSRNIWRMRKFYEAYRHHKKLLALLTEISWSNHLHILSKTKSIEEKYFYLELAAKKTYSERTFARIINSGTFERTLLANQKLSAVLTEFPVDTQNVFKDVYSFEFTGMNEPYKEFDLQKSLIYHMKHFLLEMGEDFSFLAEEFLVQVGDNDYKIDLLLQHRGLNALVALELKVDAFKPEYLGKLEFYLEALDQHVKKPHENPSIGLLICKTRDDEVVKFALNRSVSPALIAEYETKLIDKALLQRKLEQLSNQLNTFETEFKSIDSKSCDLSNN